MKMMLMAASIAALSLASADLALAQGNGKGGGDKAGPAAHGGGPGKGGDRGEGKARGQADHGAAKIDRREARAEAHAENRGPDRPAHLRADNRGPDRPAHLRADNRGPDRSAQVRVERGAGPQDGPRALRDDRRDDAERSDRIFFRVADRGLIAGCPPGLAKKNNGCLPPGQARKMSVPQTRYDAVWDRWNDDYDYRYDNGYLYRTSPQGGLLGYLPVLGGALGLGQLWPAQYGYDPVPTYYSSYYGLPDRYQYRYADGALYGLDPQTQTIAQVAALLTGQGLERRSADAARLRHLQRALRLPLAVHGQPAEPLPI
jgi:hypothetical protein